MEKSKRKSRTALTACGIVLIVLCLLSLRLGSAHMENGSFFAALCDVYGETAYGRIIYGIRLPRTIAAVIAGALLAMSGCILQSVTGNSMASPNLVGVNSGAGFAVILSLSLFPQLFAFTPVFAFLGAFCATLFITLISKKTGFSKTNVILSGLAFGAVLSSGISLISLIDTDALVSYNAFSIGSLSGVGISQLTLPALVAASVLIICIFFSGSIDILSLGDNTAHSLGISVAKTRCILMLLASASAGAAVSFAGLLGFVGLMSPHIASRLCSSRSRVLIPMSAMVGACLVVLSDLSGRVLFAPTEIPAGIITALLGAPFFLLLVLGKER